MKTQYRARTCPCQLWPALLLPTLVTTGWIGVRSAMAGDQPLPDSDVLMRALSDELARSMNLQVEDLERPYFIQFNAEDGLSYQIAASYGSVTASDDNRTRTLQTCVRVGSMETDNTNFTGGGAFGRGGGRGQTALPVDDDYVALRQAIWRVVDADYMSAVETLTQKRAYLKDKNIVDRPHDFSPAPKVEQVEPTAVLKFDAAAWETKLHTISAQFKKYEAIQDSSARLVVSAGNSYVVNSEGTRLRTSSTAAVLIVAAQLQAADGMRLADSRHYVGQTTADLPSVEKVVADIDALVAELSAAAAAAPIEHYVGPVLFDDVSAGQVFQALLAGGVSARPDPVGESRRGAGGESLDAKLGTRILPKSFQVWDDPTVPRLGSETLLGHYRFDDEGVAAARVNLIADGKLNDLCRSRAPSRKLSGSNGHGRRAMGNAFEGGIGCLFIQDADGVPDAALKQALIAAAKDAGLEFGVRVKSLRPGGFGGGGAGAPGGRRPRAAGGGGGARNVGDPIIAYKVFVADGHEEPFRGCEFAPVDVSALKKIVAAGDTPRVYNPIAGLRGAGSTSVIAPPVVFEELELTAIQQEHDKPPLLRAPAHR